MASHRLRFGIGLALLCASASCAQVSPNPAGRPPAVIDGDRPIHLNLSQKLRSWASQRGSPAGTTLQHLLTAAPLAQARWNPQASGTPQGIDVDLDDAPAGHCAERRADGSPTYSAWTQPGFPSIYLCPSWPLSTLPSGSGLDGLRGALWTLMHELGHQLGGGHVLQLGRPIERSGPVMCGWSARCVADPVEDYQLEDVTEICRAGLRGRCPSGLPGSDPEEPADDSVYLEPL